MKKDFPQSVKACLWSYDTNRIDMSDQGHRRILIEQVLNKGSMDALMWLFTQMSQKEIVDTIENSMVSQWDKRSLNLWSLVFSARPKRLSRFVLA